MQGTVLQECSLLSCVGIYLLGTLLQVCRLFKQCQNLPAGQCVAVLQAV